LFWKPYFEHGFWFLSSKLEQDFLEEYIKKIKLWAGKVEERLFLEMLCLRNGWFSCVLEVFVLECFSQTGTSIFSIVLFFYIVLFSIVNFLFIIDTIWFFNLGNVCLC
jgi:hypothetical protein